MNRPTVKHRSFALVLAGGGVRGLAHAGMLRALEQHGWYPSAIVGVSMGAIVGATYSLNRLWYSALVTMNTEGFPEPLVTSDKDIRARIRTLIATERAFAEMLLGWGVGSGSLVLGQRLLLGLTGGKDLRDGRIPVAVTATDLRSGQRVVFEHGNAADAVYASSALPGILPPFVRDDQLLADGSYADAIPIDVAQAFGADVIIAVDPSQINMPYTIHNGFEAMRRAEEISHSVQAQSRLLEADLVIRPEFPFLINALDFHHKRLCVAAGICAVRASLPQLRQLLQT